MPSATLDAASEACALGTALLTLRLLAAPVAFLGAASAALAATLLAATLLAATLASALLAATHRVTLHVLPFSLHLSTSLRADAIPGVDRPETEPGTIKI